VLREPIEKTETLEGLSAAYRDGLVVVLRAVADR
jgi:hypothetical protein